MLPIKVHTSRFHPLGTECVRRKIMNDVLTFAWPGQNILFALLPNCLNLANISASLNISSFSIAVSSPSEADVIVLPVKM